MMAAAATEFAPAERGSRERLAAQAACFTASPLFAELLNRVPESIVILNRERQIVYANRAALEMAGAATMSSVVGMRPGDFWQCRHADESPGGCGTTLFCRYCGAVNAVLASQAGKFSIQECRLTRKRNASAEALDLRVWASPMRVAAEDFTFFAIANIADEKRRLFLERIFLHDVMNTATALRGFSFLLGTEEDEPGREMCIEQIGLLSERIIQELEAHRQLIAAESGDLRPQIEIINARQLVTEVVRSLQRPDLLNRRQIAIPQHCDSVDFASDRTLLTRVLGNMMKNALEASPPGAVVTIGCIKVKDAIAFSVHNPTYMPEEIRLQIFNRSFTTKGAGRGLGTYSMKFLTEKYLRGKIAFQSVKGEGTTFTATYPVSWTGAALAQE
jgi:signal transduction histidine kinase